MAKSIRGRIMKGDHWLEYLNPVNLFIKLIADLASPTISCCSDLKEIVDDDFYYDTKKISIQKVVVCSCGRRYGFCREYQGLDGYRDYWEELKLVTKTSQAHGVISCWVPVRNI